MMYGWSAERSASRAHIRVAIRHALWEKATIATKSDEWYASASIVSREWRDRARDSSLRTLARRYLDYWRMRASLRAHYGNASLEGRKWEQVGAQPVLDREAACFAL